MVYRKEILIAQLVDDEAQLTMAEICRVCGVSAEVVIDYVEFGVVEPVDVNRHPWCFAPAAIGRLHTARRLTRDLGLNTPGIALALELLDEIASLRKHMI